MADPPQVPLQSESNVINRRGRPHSGAAALKELTRWRGGRLGPRLDPDHPDRPPRLATINQLSPQDQATAAEASGSGQLPDLAVLPAPVRTWLESAYGQGIGDIFLYVAPVALIAFLVTLFIKEVPLRARNGPPAEPAEAERTS